MDKCFFLGDWIEYMCHVKQTARLRLFDEATDGIHALQHPKNVTKLKCFLGLYNEFRRSVPNLAHNGAPVNSKLERNQTLHLATEQDWNPGSGNGLALNDVPLDTGTSKSDQMFKNWQWHGWQASRGRLIAKEAWKTRKSRGVLIKIVELGWKNIRHKELGMSLCWIGRPVAMTVSRRIAVYHLNRFWRAVVDIEQYGRERKNNEMEIKIVRVWLWSSPQSQHKSSGGSCLILLSNVWNVQISLRWR